MTDFRDLRRLWDALIDQTGTNVSVRISIISRYIYPIMKDFVYPIQEQARKER